MPIQLTVLLFNRTGPFHCCQHIAAIVTDLDTSRTFDIDYRERSYRLYIKSKLQLQENESKKNNFKNCYVYVPASSAESFQLLHFNHKREAESVPIDDIVQFKKKLEQLKNLKDDDDNTDNYLRLTYKEIRFLITSNGGHEPSSKSFTMYPSKKDNPLNKFITSGIQCCIGITHLYSDEEYDSFVAAMKKEFYMDDQYDFFSNNCADAVNFAMKKLCPEKNTDIFFNIYRAICCPFFFGSLGLSCFPSPPCACTAPQDIYDKARWLSQFTRYGNKITGIKHSPDVYGDRELKELKLHLVTKSKLDSSMDDSVEMSSLSTLCNR